MSVNGSRAERVLVVSDEGGPIMTRTHTHCGLRAIVLLAAALFIHPAFAGPPLLCHPFDIGTAQSLSWNGKSSWFDKDQRYDLHELADDTVELLTPTTPVIVRMETLRRAAIYASDDALVAKQLFLVVSDRARAADRAGKPDALATFDAGYLAATLQELADLADFVDSRPGGDLMRLRIKGEALTSLVSGVDGYALVNQSLVMRGTDPSIEFAAALIAASRSQRAMYTQHADKARAGAQQDALLARNIGQISGR
jgi:hypothetical protein